jgi:hypothetical protein
MVYSGYDEASSLLHWDPVLSIDESNIEVAALCRVRLGAPMSTELLFQGSAIAVIPFWIAIIFFPLSRRTLWMVGSPWIFFDAREREIGALWVSPILFVTIFSGPLGFALYGAARLASKRA